jgi:hypothetical protein
MGFAAQYGQRVALNAKPARLAQLLRNYIPRNGGKLEMVFLNGAKTFDVASNLVLAGVPVVIFWKTKVNDEAAFVFSREFYRELAASQNDISGGDEGRAGEDQFISVSTVELCMTRVLFHLVMFFVQAFNAGVKAISNVVWASPMDPLILVPKFEMIDPDDAGVDPSSGKVCALIVSPIGASIMVCIAHTMPPLLHA